MPQEQYKIEYPKEMLNVLKTMKDLKIMEAIKQFIPTMVTLKAASLLMEIMFQEELQLHLIVSF